MNRSALPLLATFALIAVVLAPVRAYPQAVHSSGGTASSVSASATGTTGATAPSVGTVTRTWTTTRTTPATTTTPSSTAFSSSTSTSSPILTPITSTSTATSISNIIILSNNADSNADLSAIMSIALPTSLPMTSDDDADQETLDGTPDESDLPAPDVQEQIIHALLTLGQNPDNISSSDALAAARALPPPSPTAFVRYLGDGTAFIENLGYNYTQVGQQCRGLQGTLPIENVIINTRYLDGRPAYALHFFGEWACQGRVLATTSGYTGNGRPLRGSDGQVVVPRSSRFVPILI